MPPPETFERNQKALLWASSGNDESGRPTRASDAVELDVRWERRRTQTVDTDGNVIAIDATVVVDIDIAPGSLMWEGSLDDLADDQAAGTGTAPFEGLEPDEDVYEVAVFGHTPDLKGRITRRVAYLQRYAAELPGGDGEEPDDGEDP